MGWLQVLTGGSTALQQPFTMHELRHKVVSLEVFHEKQETRFFFACDLPLLVLVDTGHGTDWRLWLST